MSGESPRRNRVDPFGDLQATPARGLFTGNRGCLVDDEGNLVRHHRGKLWIVCVLRYKDWKSPLDQPRHWTPLFFLDDAVALSAGHRPCGLCRRDAYESYSAAVSRSLGLSERVGASALNDMLAAERLRPGRGMSRSGDRITWSAAATSLPDGTVILGEVGAPTLLWAEDVYEFGFSGWARIGRRPEGPVAVLTPPTSVRALGNGFTPVLHQSVPVGPM
ncbi:MAG TPA: hypothetical protein VFT85_02030 [Acidimicrobiia bacterium]|nr:hypothetical protein [Acidimicrobiia bacterium]